MEIHQKISTPNYQRLTTIEKRSIDQKLRLRDFDARHGRIETGAVVKNRKGLIGVEGRKGICYQWKEKGQCSKGDKCSFQHESNDHAQKTTPKAATPSGPSMTRGWSVSRRRSIKSKSNPGIILRQPCRYFLKGTCTRSPCECWHLPECQFYKNESGCKAGDKCLFPHHRLTNKEVRSRKRATILPKDEKVTTKMQWPLWNMYLRWVVSRKTRSRWILKEANKPGETRCKKSWDRFEEYDSRYVKQTSAGKTQVKNPHQRSPYAMKFEDGPHEETERQQRCARSKAWNLAKKKSKLKENDTAALYSPTEDPVVPLGRNLYGHPLAGLLWERQFEKVLLEYDWERVPNWECLFVNREQGLFSSVYVDDIKLAGKSRRKESL